MKRRDFLKYGVAGLALLSLHNLSESSVFAGTIQHENINLVVLTAGAGNGEGRLITHDGDAIRFVYNDGNKNPVTHAVKRVDFTDHVLYSYSRQSERFGNGHGEYMYGGGVRAEVGEDYREVRKRIVVLINRHL